MVCFTSIYTCIHVHMCIHIYTQSCSKRRAADIDMFLGFSRWTTVAFPVNQSQEKGNLGCDCDRWCLWANLNSATLNCLPKILACSSPASEFFLGIWRLRFLKNGGWSSRKIVAGLYQYCNHEAFLWNSGSNIPAVSDSGVDVLLTTAKISHPKDNENQWKLFAPRWNGGSWTCNAYFLGRHKFSNSTKHCQILWVFGNSWHFCRQSPNCLQSRKRILCISYDGVSVWDSVGMYVRFTNPFWYVTTHVHVKITINPKSKNSVDSKNTSKIKSKK